MCNEALETSRAPITIYTELSCRVSLGADADQCSWVNCIVWSSLELRRGTRLTALSDYASVGKHCWGVRLPAGSKRR